MPQKIPVSALYRFCKMMLRDHWGYIWGTAGIRWTEDRQKATDNEMARKYGDRWIGHVVADCSGVMVYIWRQYGLKIAHGSNSIKRQYMGKLQTMPKPGYGALKLRNGDDYYHIGIVSEDGTHVYESKGTLFGFVVSDVKEWDWFGPFKDVDYSGEVSPLPDGEKMSRRAEVITKKDPLNMRTGPGVGYDIIGKIPKGTIVDVWTKCENNWYFVDDDGDQGYVDGRYLAFLPPVSPKPEKDDKEPTSDDEEPQIVNYGVLIPCDTKEDADALAAFFVNAQVISGDD